MFGFLPFFSSALVRTVFSFVSARASRAPLPTPSEQHAGQSAPLLSAGEPGAASAERFHRTRPEAAPYPSSAPAARTRRVWPFRV